MRPGSITVIIACRNEEKNIANAVQSVLNSSYPLDLIDILVVDGMSEDRSKEIIMELSRNNNHVRYIANPARITPVAFNLGIENSNTEFVQILGSRHEISSNYIGDAVAILNEKKEVACVGGTLEIRYDDFINKLIIKAINSKFGMGMGNVHALKKSSYTDTAGAPVFRKEIFSKIGLFDEELIRNQDDELSYRIIKAGYKIYTSVEMKTGYEARKSINGMSKQFRQYGYWKIYVNKKHKGITTLRQIFPALFVLYLLLGFPIASLLNVPFLFWSVLAVYILSALFFNNGEGLKERFVILYIVFVMHVSYGIGYLQGIIDFLIFNKKPSRHQKQLTR